MKITKTLILFLFVFLLVSCVKPDDEEQTDVVLELIGDAIIFIEEGSDYEDDGVLVNGEIADLGYYSNINSDRIGTYYVKYVFGRQEIFRTVNVIAGPKSELLTIISNFELATNYSYSLKLDTRFSRGGVDFHTFIYEDYDVYDDYLYGTLNRTSYQMNAYTHNEYIYLDIANQIEEHYLFDIHGFWYQEQPLISKATSLITDFSLDGIKSVSKETIDNQTIYTGYLNYEDYIYAYHTKINLIPDEIFDFEVDDYIEITIIVENEHIVGIETDLLDVMQHALSENSNAEITEYYYVYTFENYGLVNEIIIPDEGIQAKNISS